MKLPNVRLPRTATGRALLGASTAMAAGLAFGGAARAIARSASMRSAIAHRAAATAADLAALWRGTDVRYAARVYAHDVLSTHDIGTLVARVALGLLVAAAFAAALRALVLWRRTRPSTRRPAPPVIALAAAGTRSAEIARRTGLSRDAIALALNVSRRG